MIACAILTTFFDLIPPWLIKLIIDEALPNQDRSYLYGLIGGIIGAYCLRNISNSCRIRLNNQLEQRVIYDMRQDVYSALQRLPIHFFEKTSTGQLMSRVSDDINHVERVFIDGTEQFVVAFLTLIGITVILFRMNWHLASVALFPIPLLALSATLYTRIVHRYYRIIRARLGELNAFVQDRISGIRDIKIYGREAHEEENFSGKNRSYCQSQLKVAKIWSIFSPTMRLLAAMGVVSILLYGSNQVMKGTLTLGELVAFLSYLGLFYEPVNQIHSLNHMVQHALAAGERVFEILDTPGEPLALQRRTGQPVSMQGRIEFRQVSFAYSANRHVLKNISFGVSPGERVALVGPSGSGKSTLFKLIPRFYPLVEGEIKINDVAISDISLVFLRSQIAEVFQEPFLFNGTIWENITYARPSATLEEVEQVSQTCYIHEFIEPLPQRYETLVGERGVRLSVGQRQRIAIARALLKNTPILLLDEPTSNLDTETEEFIRIALAHLMKGRTTLIIAHRLSTIKDADRILVISQGQLVGEGTHEQLYGQNHLYTRLYDAMFSKIAARDPWLVTRGGV